MAELYGELRDLVLAPVVPPLVPPEPKHQDEGRQE